MMLYMVASYHLYMTVCDHTFVRFVLFLFFQESRHLALSIYNLAVISICLLLLWLALGPSLGAIRITVILVVGIAFGCLSTLILVYGHMFWSVWHQDHELMFDDPVSATIDTSHERS